jgi:hypothetical protein
VSALPDHASEYAATPARSPLTLVPPPAVKLCKSCHWRGVKQPEPGRDHRVHYRLCEVCIAHKAALKLCVKCGGEKPNVAGCQLCTKCERVPHSRKHEKRVCARCGDPKPRGKQLCGTCAALGDEANRARSRARRRRRRKLCRGGCGRLPRRLASGAHSPYCAVCREKREKKCHRCHTNPRRSAHARYCEGCAQVAEREYNERRSERRRERKQEKRRQKEEQPRADRPRNSTKEWGRLNRAFQREQAGATLVAVEPTTPRRGGKRRIVPAFPNLPSAPLAKRIQQLAARERSTAYDLLPVFTSANGKPLREGTRAMLCKRLGISEKLLANWTSGETPLVDFDTADMVLSNSPWLWFDVWKGTELCSNGRTVSEVFEGTELVATPVATPKSVK